MKKSWMVNSISHSPITGISGCLIGVYASEEAAKAAVHASIEACRQSYEDEGVVAGVVVDFDKMATWFDYDPNNGCRWFITPIETP